ncbi:MAG: ROK family protein [Isosphaeraceae bacterium]|nr:ROK family protein [Isosphaeraceae bacterium]
MSGVNSKRTVVGVDLGGTKILTGIVDGENRILGRAKRDTPAKEGGAAILSAIVGSIDDALAAAGLDRDAVGAVGIGSPGPLDPVTGVIAFSANMNVRNFALGPDLSAALGGKPVLLQNDVRVGGYGEYRLGAGRGYRNLLAAFVGTGIGGCVIVDGRIVQGSTGNAGELGHMIVRAGGPKCGCGNRGCMESLASRTAIARRIAKAAKRGMPSVLLGKVEKKSGRLKSKDLAAAFLERDPVTLREVHRAAHYLGLGLGSLVNVLGPEIVIIGGGVTSALGAPWIELIRTSARRQILVDPLGSIKIEASSLGDDSGLLGASLLAREQFGI